MERLLTTAVVSIGLLAGTVLFVASQAAAAECRDIKVRQVAQAVDPTDPACDSPVSFCTAGPIKGWKNGNVFNQIQSLEPGPVVNSLVYTDDVTWFLKKGTVLILEFGVFDPVPLGTGRFAGVQLIVGGTGDYEGATGELSGRGDTSDADPNTFLGEYSGTICTPNGDGL